jgi:DNA polymerase, archaea type
MILYNRSIKLIEEDRSIDDRILEIKEKLIGESKISVELAIENFVKLDSAIPSIDQSIIAFDIEVKAKRDKFPIPEEAAYPIHSIAIATDRDRIVLINSNRKIDPSKRSEIEESLGRSIEIKYFLYEEDMIQYLLQRIQEYPFHVSFNGDGFDLPYIFYRLKRLGKESNGLIDESRIREWHVKNSIHIDLMTFFKNPSIRLYAFSAAYSSHSLDEVAKALLSHQKIEHEKWFDEMSVEELVEYSIVDAELTFKLITFDDQKVFKLMILLCRLGNIPLNSLIRRSISAWIYQWVAFEHVRRGYMIPTRKEIREVKGGFESKSQSVDKNYQGAIVLEPEVGVWEDVHVYDFASLYPSIIKQKNLSYDTVRCSGEGHEICRDNIAPTLSHWICRRSPGIISTLVGMVRDLRVKWYKSRSKILSIELDRRKRNREPFDQLKLEIEFIEMITSALKVFINASYGVIGNESFAIFCPPVAECTTDYSREALLNFKQKVDDRSMKVIYGDTDSLFIAKPIDRVMKEIIFEQSILNGMEIDRDDIFALLVLTKKKNYFGITESGKNVVKGLTGKKSNTPLIVRSTFAKVMSQYRSSILESIENNQPIDRAAIKEKVIDIVREAMTRLSSNSVEIEDLQSMHRLNKKLSELKAKSIAVTLALQRINRSIDDEQVIKSIEPGLTMYAVKTQTIPSVYQANNQSINC